MRTRCRRDNIAAHAARPWQWAIRISTGVSEDVVEQMLGTVSARSNVGRPRSAVRQRQSPKAYGPKAPPSLTVDMAFVSGLLSGIRAKGQPYEALLRQAQIDPAALDRAGAHVTVAQYATLMRSLMEQLGDEMVGLLRRPAKPGSFPLQARLAIGAPNLEVAVRHVAHASRLLYDDFSLALVRQDELAGVALVFSEPGSSTHHAHETLLRCYWRLFAWLVGNRLPVVRFDFAFVKPDYASAYARIFPAPWRFGAERTALWFEAAQLKRLVRRDAQALRGFLARMLDHMIVPPRDTGIGARVRLHIEGARPSWPDLEQTARALAMSASTLQRRLATEGTTFKALKDQLRREIAIQRLHADRVSLKSLAAELGFADSFAFQRAFKSWTGSPPGAYRKSGR